MARCKFCGQRVDWITAAGEKQVPVDPCPVFVVEGRGRKVFFDDMGGTVVGRQAWPEEEGRNLPLAFVPHRKTCQAIRVMLGEIGTKNAKSDGNYMGLGAYIRANAEVCLLGVSPGFKADVTEQITRSKREDKIS